MTDRIDQLDSRILKCLENHYCNIDRSNKYKRYRLTDNKPFGQPFLYDTKTYQKYINSPQCGVIYGVIPYQPTMKDFAKYRQGYELIKNMCCRGKCIGDDQIIESCPWCHMVCMGSITPDCLNYYDEAERIYTALHMYRLGFFNDIKNRGNWSPTLMVLKIINDEFMRCGNTFESVKPLVKLDKPPIELVRLDKSPIELDRLDKPPLGPLSLSLSSIEPPLGPLSWLWSTSSQVRTEMSMKFKDLPSIFMENTGGITKDVSSDALKACVNNSHAKEWINHKILPKLIRLSSTSSIVFTDIELLRTSLALHKHCPSVERIIVERATTQCRKIGIALRKNNMPCVIKHQDMLNFINLFEFDDTIGKIKLFYLDIWGTDCCAELNRLERVGFVGYVLVCTSLPRGTNNISGKFYGGAYKLGERVQHLNWDTLIDQDDEVSSDFKLLKDIDNASKFINYDTLYLFCFKFNTHHVID